MNIGIIVYSQTGNTLSVAKRLEQALVAAGHTANIARVEQSGSGSSARLGTAPDVHPYDAVIFAPRYRHFRSRM